MTAQRPIPGWPGYRADVEGRVWSTRRSTDPRELRRAPDRDGYLCVRFYVDGWESKPAATVPVDPVGE